ncbi:MAG: Crp/Fnr family transcriptional regulator [Epsilonproteobacteria bacterium]|nr:Crp/Fnr family transcriptional regulator [Campylobacterota bacterium]
MKIEDLQKLELFGDIDKEKLEMIASFSMIKKFQKENIVFYEGEAPRFFYGLIEGEIKLYKSSFKNTEVLLQIFKAPSMVAEMTAFEDIKFPATAQILTQKATLILIDKDRFIEMIKSDANFSFCFIKSLTKKIKILERTINQNMIYDAYTNVINYLKTHQERFFSTKKVQIAQELNMTPETLSRVLRRLRDENIIDEVNQMINLV